MALLVDGESGWSLAFFCKGRTVEEKKRRVCLGDEAGRGAITCDATALFVFSMDAALSLHLTMAQRATRENAELRAIKIEPGTLGNHDGSALFSFGDVVALATVTGPGEVRIRDELTDRSTLDINYTPLQGIPGISALAFSTALVDVFSYVLLLHLHPRSLLQINLQTYSCPPTYTPQPLLRHGQKLRSLQVSVPHPDATLPVALQSAHINAITCACLDAGVHMQSLVASSSAVIVRRGVRRNFMRGWKAGETVPIEEVGGDDDDG